MSDGGRAPSADAFGALIGQAYDVGLEASGWQPFVDRLRSTFDSELALVQFYDHQEPDRSFVVASGLGHEFLDAFTTHWGGFEGRPDDPIWQAVRVAPAGSVTANVDLQTVEEARRTEIHRLLAAPWHLDYFLTGVVANGPATSAFLSLGRTGAARCFDGDDRHRLGEGILGHLARNLALRGQFDRSRSRASVLGAVLDALPTGVLVFDRQARPIVVNRRAEELLSAGAGVSLQSRRLLAADTRVQRALDRALDSALTGPELRHPPTPVTVRRDAREPGVRITFTPLRGRWRGGELEAALPPDARCVALLEPIDPAELPGRSALAARFGFTAAEDRICRLLLAGRNLQEAADQLDVSRNTAKTHLTRIFDKTGVRNQVALISLLRP
jgi:DNA-binding CsgD family transcriptional regulator/PAS domain-containing protein